MNLLRRPQTMGRKTGVLLLAVAPALLGLLHGGGESDEAATHSGWRRLLLLRAPDPRTVEVKTDAGASGAGGKVSPFFASKEWCNPPREPPLPYDNCPNRDVVWRTGLWSGLTNALRFNLYGVIQAFRTGHCYVLDQTAGEYGGPFLSRRDPPLENVPDFLGRYFEPIGLPWGGQDGSEAPGRHPIAANAKRVLLLDYVRDLDRFEGKETAKWREANRGAWEAPRSIPSVGITDHLDNVRLKKTMLRRMWRLLPATREASCARLSAHGIKDEYIAFSFRRGDKVVEKRQFTPTAWYIREAEKNIIPTRFGGRVPPVFVATDDCRVLGELRSMRPDWTFVSECDRVDNHGEHGFDINDMSKWTLEQTDAHHHKFFAEMIGMAEAKVVVGVSYTNVAFWVYWMRGYDKDLDSYKFVDNPAFAGKMKIL